MSVLAQQAPGPPDPHAELGPIPVVRQDGGHLLGMVIRCELG